MARVGPSPRRRAARRRLGPAAAPLPVPGGGHRHHHGRHPAAAPRAVVPEDDYGNPFLSPGYSPSSPPLCVGVQRAGVSHGVPTPLLYFRNRYYDMCICIDCPDSGDHVIWFLPKVEVDPACLDVKFSDGTATGTARRSPARAAATTTGAAGRRARVHRRGVGTCRSCHRGLRVLLKEILDKTKAYLNVWPAGPTTACSLQVHRQTPSPSYLPAFLPCLPTFTPASLSSSLPTFLLPPYYPSSCLLTLLTTTSTHPPSHPQPQLASHPTIKPPLRRSPPCTPSTWSVVPLP